MTHPLIVENPWHSSETIAGADAVTLSPRLLRAALSAPDIDRAVDDFIKDWKTVYGTTTLP